MTTDRPPLRTWDCLIATWFGVGYLPKAPGTWGSLAALPFGYILANLGGAMALGLAALALFPLGVLASERFSSRIGISDPGSVVADEVVGQWIALMPAIALGPIGYLYAFLAFRFFDILKPWPVNVLDRRLKGGFGIMTDDAMAGAYAALLIWTLGHVLS